MCRGDSLVTDVSLFFIAQCGALKGSRFLLSSLCLAGRRCPIQIPPTPQIVNLQSLNPFLIPAVISHGRAVTDEGVEAATSLAPNLTILDVRHCPQVNSWPCIKACEAPVDPGTQDLKPRPHNLDAPHCPLVHPKPQIPDRRHQPTPSTNILNTALSRHRWTSVLPARHACRGGAAG